MSGSLLAGLVLRAPALQILLGDVVPAGCSVSGRLPGLPQELGGGAAHCAQLDIIPKKLAPEMVAVLFDKPPVVGTEDAVVRSQVVHVYHASADTLLIKPLALPGRRADYRTTYELTRESIAGVVWCAYGK